MAHQIPSFSLLSLNVEGSRHLHIRAMPLLRRCSPTVMCLQELNEEDYKSLQQGGYPFGFFAPMMVVEGKVQGLALLSRLPFESGAPHQTHWLQRLSAVGPPGRIAMPNGYNLTDHTTVQYAVLAASIRGVRVLNTHLMVTHEGESTPAQQAMARKVLAFCQAQRQQYGNVLLCGDFNAPRGRATWRGLANTMQDNIPRHVQTTLDATLHLRGHLPDFPKNFVVDGLFSGGEVAVREVRLHGGVSDHMAIMARVQAL